MRTTTLFLTCLLGALVSRAQVNYTFDQTTVPYAPLTGDVSCTFDPNGFDDITELDGEVFQLFGQSFTAGSPYSMTVGEWGFVRFDGLGSAVIIDGLFTELEAVDATSAVSYRITGSPGARVFTAQWTNWHLAQGPAGNHASFQIGIEQATGIVSVHTGPNSGGGMVFNDLTGPNCGIFMANSSFTQCYAKLWVEVDPYDPLIDSFPNFDFEALHALPPSGTLYRFIPGAGTAGIASPVAPAPIDAFVAGDALHIRMPDDIRGVPVRLTDASGREVLRARVDGPATVLSLQGLAPGVHVLYLEDGSRSPSRVLVP